MDYTFLIIIYFILVIILFLLFRICAKSTVWSCLIAAVWFALLISLLIQVVVPCSLHDNRHGVEGVLIIITIVLILVTIYIADRLVADIDPYAVAITDRNVILY